MHRSLGYLAVAIGIGLVAAARLAAVVVPSTATVGSVPAVFLVTRVLSALAVVALAYGGYVLVVAVALRNTRNKRRRHSVRSVLRLTFGVVAVVATFAVVTEQWVGLLFSVGIVGVAVTFALQQPLFSLVGWFYIVVKRPYRVGDRVAIEGSKGDVVDVDLFVTTLWEINGPLVASDQPSGRTITVPNSVVLSSHVVNYAGSDQAFPYVWNELTVQVAYETDLDYATETMRRVADDFLGDRMRARVADYRERLAETPVELEVNEGPSVNLVQEESWVELRVRYLVDPKRSQRVRNDLYRRVLTAFNDAPDRVQFPLGRNR